MKLADYSDPVTADQLDAALRQGGFEGVFHYLGGNIALRVEDPAIVISIRRLGGWPQMGIFVPSLGAVNGAADAQRATQIYLFPSGSRMYLDVEPGEFDQDPQGWATASDGWCDGIRSGGFSPGIYGVDRTVAICANHADTIWRAVPGQCDPAGPGLDPAFFAGRRAIQCTAATLNGINFDVSYSQFEVRPEEEMKAVIVIGPNGTQWVVLPSGHRFGVSSQGDLATLLATGQYVQGGNVSQGQLDQIPLLTSNVSSQLLNHQHSIPGIPGGHTGTPEVPV